MPYTLAHVGRTERDLDSHQPVSWGCEAHQECPPTLASVNSRRREPYRIVGADAAKD